VAPRAQRSPNVSRENHIQGRPLSQDGPTRRDATLSPSRSLPKYYVDMSTAIEQAPPFPTPTFRVRYVAGDQTVGCRPAAECIEQSAWHASYASSFSSDPVRPDQVRVEVVFPAERSWYLDSRRELAPLRGAVYPPWPVGCFAVLGLGGGLFQVGLDPAMHFQLRQSGDSLTVAFTLRDRTACGLRLWGEHKLPGSPSHRSFHVVLSRLQQLSDALWAEPFPEGARSVICITDHSDWDSAPKASTLCQLFAAHDIRITKGVFPAADAGWDYGPGLDSPEYAAVIDRWHETGHEIAYHGIGSGRDAPTDLDECRRRIDRLDAYAPQTWIDHGCGEYAFVRSARLPGGIGLPETLLAKGVRNFWSYTDAWQNPAIHLDVRHPRGVLSSFGDLATLLWRRGLTGPLQLAYLATIPVKNLVGDAECRRVMNRPWSPAEWAGLTAKQRLLGEMRRHPPYLYGPGGDCGPQGAGDMMLFDTVLLNHLMLQLCPSNVEQLAQDNGLLIAHTYLGAVHRKGGRNCFKAGSQAECLEGFRENVEHISALQKRGEVITLPIRDLREALERHAQTRIRRTAEGWEVQGNTLVGSHTPYRIEGRHMARDRHGLYVAPISGAALLGKY
jgi:hypothetical protein